MNRRSFLKNTGIGMALMSMVTGCRMAVPDLTMTDDEVLSLAQERISQHRQGLGTVAVRTPDGRPVPGAVVKMEQIRHAFLFGCNFFLFGQIRNSDREQAYRERFAALLNYATLPFYWAGYEPKHGSPQYASTDEMVDWCQRQGILCKGHPLAWDHPVSAPEWLPVAPGDVQRLSLERVRDIVERFTERINIWDVVNEPTDLSRFSNPMNMMAVRLGAVPFTRLHLQAARAANPAATLLVNDYRTDTAYYRILERLREGGKPLFDAIGLQSHMHEGRWPLHNVWQVCDTYHRLGVPLHFTETTVVSGRRVRDNVWSKSTSAGETRQADDVTKFYTAVFAHPAVEALTWWDFSDDGAWQGAPAGWLRQDMSPKPVYERLMALIKGAWWTTTRGATDSRGEFATRAFYGTYHVTVYLPNGRTCMREVSWQRGQVNRIDCVV